MTVEEFNSLSESQQIAIINSKGKLIGELKDVLYTYQLYALEGIRVEIIREIISKKLKSINVRSWLFWLAIRKTKTCCWSMFMISLITGILFDQEFVKFDRDPALLLVQTPTHTCPVNTCSIIPENSIKSQAYFLYYFLNILYNFLRH